MKLIKNGLVFDSKEGFKRKDLLIEGKKIIKIKENISEVGCEIIFADECYVVPGFIDLHTHGANGYDVMYSNYEDLNSLSLFYASKGVTSFLPTVMTAPLEDIYHCLENLKNTIKKGTEGSKILGINLEGPFLNKKFNGAQPEDYIIPASVELIDSLNEKSGNNILLMTIAPEIEGAKRVLEHLKGSNMVLSVGHSDLDYNSAMKVFEGGLGHVTHLFNAMSGMHHRAPGLPGAAIDNENVIVEIIADGVHINPSVIRLVNKCKRAGKIVLITDSIQGAGLEDGLYAFGGQMINIRKGIARLPNGSLAGSTLAMDDAVRNMVNRFNIPLVDSINMACANPAKAINVFTSKGSLSIGKDADIIILDKVLKVIMTIVEGNIIKT